MTNARPTIEHNRTSLADNPHITSLLLQLSDRSLFRRLSSINQASRYLDAYFVDWRAVLFLQEEFRTCFVSSAFLAPYPFCLTSNLSRLWWWAPAGILVMIWWQQMGSRTGFLLEDRYHAYGINIGAFWPRGTFSMLPCSGLA